MLAFISKFFGLISKFHLGRWKAMESPRSSILSSLRDGAVRRPAGLSHGGAATLPLPASGEVMGADPCDSSLRRRSLLIDHSGAWPGYLDRGGSLP
jgi:hypothetical protein